MQLTARISEKNLALLSFLISIFAILVALAIGAVLIALSGIDPLKAYGYMLEGSFGNLYGFGETLSRFVPLLFTGLGFAVAFNSGFFSIGAEGQLYMGALGAAIAATLIHGLPAPLHITLTLLVGFAFGAVWSFIAGVLKVTIGANELINTMMLNYVAILIVELLVQGPLKDPNSMTPQTVAVADTAKLPYIIPGTRLHLGFILALLAAYATYYFMYRTPYGYQLRTIGANPRAAAYAGIGIAGGTLLAAALSGGLSGLGGAVELMGSQFRLLSGFSPGYGLDGIGVAVMGRNKPIGIVMAALLFAVIRVGAGAMQRGIGVPSPLLSVIQGLLIVIVIASNYLTDRLSATVIGGRA
ncbi:MAG: ABC transporter permease [Chloroflexi bacterium]|nr:ABC transporter permease [Chloroflexota bacterium]